MFAWQSFCLLLLATGYYTVKTDDKHKAPSVPDWRNESIRFGCIYHEDQFNFHFADSNDTVGLNTLLGKFKNKGFAFYVLGFGEKLSAIPDFYFQCADEWFAHSKMNLCYVQYPYKNRQDGAYELYQTVKSGRMDFVADEVIDFIRKLIERKQIVSLNEIIVLGFSLGGHIGEYICEKLKIILRGTDLDGQQIPLLLGLDPAAVTPMLNGRYIQKGSAAYVQCIRTSYIFGTSARRCDCNITVNSTTPIKNALNFFGSSHLRAIELNDLIISKRYVFIATRKGPGEMIKASDPKAAEKLANLGADECLIGVYLKDHENRRYGDFKLQVPEEAYSMFRHRT